MKLDRRSVCCCANKGCLFCRSGGRSVGQVGLGQLDKYTRTDSRSVDERGAVIALTTSHDRAAVAPVPVPVPAPAPAPPAPPSGRRKKGQPHMLERRPNSGTSTSKTTIGKRTASDKRRTQTAKPCCAVLACTTHARRDKSSRGPSSPCTGRALRRLR